MKSKHPHTARSYQRSSSFFMAILFTILCGVVALCLGFFINYFAKGHFIHSTEEVLNSEIKYISALDQAKLLERKKANGRLYVYLNEQGNDPDVLSKDIDVLSEGIIVFKHKQSHKRYAAKVHNMPDGRNLLIAFDITEISKDFRFMQLIGASSILFVMLVVFVAYVISIFVVRGTNKIAATAQDIMLTGDLSRRIDVSNSWDDLSHMTAVLNMLLDRVEELVQGVRDVSDNIAHDLRTPLTRLKNHIEELQKTSKRPEDFETLVGEADHILRTFHALLRISRIETERRRDNFQDINVKTLMADVVSFYEPLAEEQNIDLTVELIEYAYEADPDLLFQAYVNIVDNALKYTPAGGKVSVNMRKDEQDKLCIEITDTGPAISEAEKERIFERFYRAEKSRTTKGTGLGLSLVKAVLDLHGADIRAVPSSEGLKIITIL